MIFSDAEGHGSHGWKKVPWVVEPFRGGETIYRIVWSLCFAHSMSHALVCNSEWYTKFLSTLFGFLRELDFGVR